MTNGESIDEVGHLVGLFQRMSQEDIEFWHIQFLKYPQGPVRAAVDSFAERHGDFVDRPGLLAEIQNRAMTPGATARRRALAAAAEAQERLRLADAAQKDADAEREKACAAIAGLPPERVEALKQMAMSGMPAKIKASMARRDPFQSPIMRALMVAHMEAKHA